MAFPIVVTIHNRRAPITQPHLDPGPSTDPAVVTNLRALDLCRLTERALHETFAAVLPAGSPSAIDMVWPSHRQLSPVESIAPRFVQVQFLIRSPLAVLLNAAAHAAGTNYEAEFGQWDCAESAVADADAPDYGVDMFGHPITVPRIRNALVGLRQAMPIRMLEHMVVGPNRHVEGPGIELNFQLPGRTFRRNLPNLTVGLESVDAGPVQPRLAVFDMDSTLIDQEVIDEIAAQMGPQYASAVSAITERAMRGELDFEASLRERVGLLKGIPADDLFEKVKPRITIATGARKLTSVLLNSFAAIGKPELETEKVIISGGFIQLAKWIGSVHTLHTHKEYANTLGTIESTDPKTPTVLSGLVKDPIVGPLYKRRKLLSRRVRREAADGGFGHVLAVGDGANDLFMLRAADIGVAYRAKALPQRVAPLRLNAPVELVIESNMIVACRVKRRVTQWNTTGEAKLRAEDAALDLKGENFGLIDVMSLAGWDHRMLTECLPTEQG